MSIDPRYPGPSETTQALIGLLGVNPDTDPEGYKQILRQRAQARRDQEEQAWNERITGAPGEAQARYFHTAQAHNPAFDQWDPFFESFRAIEEATGKKMNVNMAGVGRPSQNLADDPAWHEQVNRAMPMNLPAFQGLQKARPQRQQADAWYQQKYPGAQ